MDSEFKNYLLKVTDSSECEEIEVIQSLWSGYGKISRYQLKDSALKTVVVKHIELNKANEHPRGWNSDLSHNRKIRSYEVEINWYEQWNQHCEEACRTASFLGSFSKDQDHWIVLEDLDAQYPLRKQSLELLEVKTCLCWLANFHGQFLNQEPDGLWEIGTYWHLDTRPDEFEKIAHQELKDKAHQIDELLNGCFLQTIVHGDAKLANFCFSPSGENVAAVDFQYVGKGCGMKDVAYFLGSCLSSNDCDTYADSLLDFYFIELRKAVAQFHPHVEFERLEEEWRKMYPVAWTDFTRFLLGWMPTHQKVNGYSLRMMKEVLTSL